MGAPSSGTPGAVDSTVPGPGPLLDALLAASPQGVLVESPDGRRLRSNAGFTRLTGWSERDLAEQRRAAQPHPDDLPAVGAARTRVVAGEVERLALSLRLRHRDGHWLHTDARLCAVRGAAGRLEALMWLLDEQAAPQAAPAPAAGAREAEDALLYRATFEEAGVGITHMAPDGTRLRVNRSFCEMLGYDPAGFLALPIGQLLHPDDSASFLAARERLLRGEIPAFSMERRYRHRDGRWIWGLVTSTLCRPAGDGVPYTIAIVRDISARKQAEEDLRASEERFRATFEQAPFALAHWTADGRWLRVNRRFVEMFGYEFHELAPLGWRDLNHPGELLIREENMRRLEGGDVQSLVREKRYVRRDGSVFWARVRTSVVRDRDGRADYVVSALEDITERKLAEEALRASEERFRDLIEFSSDWYWEQDDQFRFTSISGNEAATRELLSPDYLGKRRWELPWLVGPGGWDEHRETLEQHKPYRDLILSRFARDGTLRYISISGRPVFDAEGRFTGYRGTSSDVTQRVVSERRLRDSESRSRLLSMVVEQSSEAIVLVDLDNVVIAWNPGAAALYGHSPAEAIGTNFTRLVMPAADEAQIAAAIAEVRAGRRVTRIEARQSRSGRRMEVETSFSPLNDSQGTQIGGIGVSRDISARLVTERALRHSEARNRLLAAVVEQSTDSIVIKDLDNVVLSWNPAAQRTYGWSAAEAIGRNMTLLARPASTGEQVAERIARLRKGLPGAWQALSFRRDGTPVHLDVTVAPLHDEGGVHVGEISIARDVTERERAAQALRLTEARNRELALIVDQSRDAIITKDLDNRVVTWNRGAEYLFGWSADEVRGRNFTALVEPSADGVRIARTTERIRARESRIWETIRTTKSGAPVHVEVSVSPLYDESGQHLGEVSVNRDITQRVLAEEALREHRLFLAQAQEMGGIGSWSAAIGSGDLTWSDETLRIFGLTREAFDGRTDTFWRLVHPEDSGRVRATVDDAIATGSPYVHEFRIVRPDGTERWVYEQATVVRDRSGQAVRAIGVTQDITERRAAHERIRFLATRDPLTELPNRLLLQDRIEQGMAAASRNDSLLAVLFVDLDHFKTINDSLGHAIGDEMLKQVAQRLMRCVRAEDTLARLGGDEFVVLLQGLHDSQGAAQVARKILAMLSRPCMVEGHQLSTSCSIGISFYPTDGEDAQTLMKNADAAMYHAKERGRGHYQYFSSELHARAVERLTVETALRAAIERDEFELHFQPQVSVGGGRTVGVEALLRWRHPSRGLLAPGAFIRIAEDSGLITPIGEWVLEAACRQARHWLDLGHPPLRVAVNVSVGQLSRDFVRTVARVLDHYRLAPGTLELEVTESLLMQQVDENVKLLRRLGDMGVQVAVDDFGTGYSSLAYLKKFPLDALKIDRTFVRDIGSDPDDAAITSSVVAIGRNLGLRVVAEGVEQIEQLELLRKMGCDEYQGYVNGRPLPADAFAARFLAPGLNLQPRE